MSSTRPTIPKQPLKVIEVPLSKFSEEVIPYHQRIFTDYKVLVQELIAANDINRLSKETRNKKRTIKQLNDLTFELDTLRAQVEDKDLDVFDSKTVSLRKLILNLTNGYAGLEKTANQVISAHQEQIQRVEDVNPFDGAQQIQISANLDDLKLKSHEDTLKNVEAIQQDVQDLHGMYSQLHQMVGEQGEHVEVIEQNVEVTQENVDSGLKQLVKAHKLKALTYPLTGAVVGTAVGGPIGFVAGAKIGAIAALGFGVAGYIVGSVTKRFKKQKIEQDVPQKSDDNSANVIADKKDI